MRSVLLVLGLTFAVALPCQAQEAKPNTLTPKEIADGWILLFDGETTFGWQVHIGVGTKDGSLGVERFPAQATSSFGPFTLEFDYKIKSFDDKKRLAVHVDSASAEVEMEPGNADWHHASVSMTHGSLEGDNDKASLRSEWKPAGAAKGRLTALPAFKRKHNWHTIKIVPGNPLDVVSLRNIKIKPRDLAPIFNGKDLAGWKEFPGKKSKFTVTDKGDLNVKDGPGDLQTTGKYQNFILQLECISNGKHLNSGIFFRCRDNEYQNGYEAQIRNQFTAEPTQDYVIEEYDPKTNKLVEKKKIKSTAVDYGTGAIYRRQPARKEMSKDGEWFSMTIIAHGNHLATWVNGVQVTDWTDNRPVSDNARTGRKLEAGHISIQGHDPTTDLSFRNLRIAELPGKK